MTAHIEALLPPAIRTQFPSVRVVTETPADLASTVPLVRVVGIGGTGDQYQFDSPRVDLDAFAATRDEARTLAQSLHDWLLRDLPGQMLADSFVLDVTEFLSPTWTPYENTNVRRFVLSVELRLHTRSYA